MKDFSPFLDTRRYKNWPYKLDSWKYLSEDVFHQFFPQHRGLHFCSPAWTPFRGRWKSAAAAAHYLILVEVEGKWPLQVPICGWQPNIARCNTSLLYLFSIFSTTSSWYLCQLQIGTCDKHWPETDLQQGICQLPLRRLTPVLLKLPTVSIHWGEFRVESQALCSRETGGTGLLDSQIFSGTDFLIPTLTFVHI